MRLISHMDPSSMLTDVDINPDRYVNLGSGDDFGERPSGVRMIHQDAESAIGKFLFQPKESRLAWTNKLIGNEPITRAAQCYHLGFGDCSTLELRDARVHFHSHDVRHLMCLDVRSQSVRIACDVEHALQIGGYYLFV